MAGPQPLSGEQDPGRSYNPGSKPLQRFSFTSRWRLAVDPRIVWAEVGRLLTSDDPIAWWPAVRARNDGSTLSLRIRSGFGYSVEARATHIVMGEESLTFRLDGDIVGEGSVERGEPLVITMDVTALPRFMQVRALRPVLTIGHHAVMWRGRRRFSRWLQASAARG